MKIIISPSKTKKLGNLQGMEEFKAPLFPKITERIIEKVASFTSEEIEKKFKLKKEQAEKLHKFYNNWKNEKYGHALSSYSGIAYKSLNVEGFSREDIEFAEGHIVILSALYGILTPMTKLKEYRLDMTNSIFKDSSLYEIWKNEVRSYFSEEEVIINLASREYSKLLETSDMYEFEFFINEKGKLKQISTNSKKMRGFTAGYIVKNKITDLHKLRDIELDGYVYNKEMSSERRCVYIKDI